MGGLYQPRGPIARGYKVFFILLWAARYVALLLTEFIGDKLRQSGKGRFRIGASTR